MFQKGGTLYMYIVDHFAFKGEVRASGGLNSLFEELCDRLSSKEQHSRRNQLYYLSKGK